MNKTKLKNMDYEIVPAIIPNDFAEISKKTKNILGFTNIVQLDLIDGKYVKNKTWPFNDMGGIDWQNILTETSGMPHWNEVDYEIDLMLTDVPKHFKDLVIMGPKRIVFHLPNNPYELKTLKDFIKNIDPYYKNEIEIGLAYESNTDTTDIVDLKDEIKFVQCMGIGQVGFQGVDFDKTVFERINFVKENLPEHLISVDGGVNNETIVSLYKAGVRRFVCGSVIFTDEDPKAAIDELYALIENSN